MKHSAKKYAALAALVSIMLCIMFFAGLTRTACASVDEGFADLEAARSELAQLVDKASQSIVLIIVYDDTGMENVRGSGFFVSSDGRIVTNAETMKGAYSAEVLSKGKYYDKVAILARDEDNDLALIQVRAIDEVPLALDSDYIPVPGDRVVSIGRSGLKKAVSEGFIKSVRTRGGQAELIEVQTTRSILNYSTGKDGPLLSMAGIVIGMTSGRIAGDQEYDVIPRTLDDRELRAVNLPPVKLLLTEAVTPEQLQPAKSSIGTRRLIRKVKTVIGDSFATLYDGGFPMTLAVVIAGVVIIGILHWLAAKLKHLILRK